MQIKITKLADTIIALLLFLQVAIFNFLNISGEGIKIICSLIMIRFALDVIITGKIYKIVLKNVWSLLIVLLIGYASARLGYDYHADVFFSNYLAIVYVLIPTIYFSYMFEYKYDFIKQVINKSFWIINIYGIINMAVACVQVKVDGFLTGVSTWTNPMREDLICGLMGYSATPQFGLFACLVILMNLYVLDYGCISQKKRMGLSLYIVFLIALSIVISAFNDNKIVYVELPAFIVYYLYITGRLDFLHRKINKNVFKIVLSITVLLLLCVGIYVMIPSVNDAVHKNFGYAIELFIQAMKTDAVLGYGSADRIYMVIYAFKRYEALKLGYGMGAYTWHAGEALGFRHFGQADLGAFLCLSGLFFTTCVFLVVVVNFARIICGKSNQRFDKLCVALFLLLMLFYTQVITINTVGIIMLFCASVFGIVEREKRWA